MDSRFLELIIALKRFRGHMRGAIFVQGLCRTTILAIAVFSIACICDFFIDLPDWGRYALTGVMYNVVAGYGIWAWLLPVVHRRSLENIAWEIEQRSPELKERLISAIELRKQSSIGVSSDLISQLADKAIADIRGLDVASVFPMPRRHIQLTIGTICILCGLFWIPPLQLFPLASRVLRPAPYQGSVGMFSLKMTSPRVATCVEGDRVKFVMETDRETLRVVEFFIRDGDGRIRRETLKRKASGEPFAYRSAPLHSDIAYWAKAGKVKTPVRTISVIQRPRIEYFSGRYFPPAHSRQPPAPFHSSTGDLKALMNTDVGLVIRASKPLSGMEIIIDELVVPVELSSDRRSGRCRFTITRSTKYRIRLIDINGLGSSEGISYEITMIPDQPPQVMWFEPEEELYVRADGTVHMEWHATDDFGIAKQELLCRVPGTGVQMIPLHRDATEFELDFARLRLEVGDEARLSLIVSDALKQTTESQVCRITIVDRSDLAGASAFKAGLADLRSELLVAEERLNEINASLEDVQDGQKSSIARSIDLGHNLVMLDHRINRFDRQLLEVITSASKLRGSAFFPTSRTAIEAMLANVSVLAISGYHHELEDLQVLQDGTGRCVQVIRDCFDLITELERQADGIVARTLGSVLEDSLEDESRRVAKGRSLGDFLSHAKARALRYAAMLPLVDSEELRELGSHDGCTLEQLEAVFGKFMEDVHKRKVRYKSTLTIIERLNDGMVQSVEDELIAVVERLRAEKDNADWSEIERLKEALIAQVATTEDELKDLTLLDIVLSSARNEEHVGLAEQAVAGFIEMREYHDVLVFVQVLKQKQQSLKHVVDQMIAPAGAERDGTDELDSIIDSIENLKHFPILGGSVEKIRAFSNNLKWLRSVENHLGKIGQFHKQGNMGGFVDAMEQATAKLAKAVEGSEELLAGHTRRRFLTRAKLQEFLPTLSEQLQGKYYLLNDMLEDEYDDEVRSIALLNRTVYELRQIAAQLENEALVLVSDDESRQGRVLFLLAVSAGIKKICVDQLIPATHTEGDEDYVEEYGEWAQLVYDGTLELEKLIRLVEHDELAQTGERSVGKMAGDRQHLTHYASEHLDAVLLFLIQASEAVEAAQKSCRNALLERDDATSLQVGNALRKEMIQRNYQLLDILGKHHPHLVGSVTRTYLLDLILKAEQQLAELRSEDRRRLSAEAIEGLRSDWRTQVIILRGLLEMLGEEIKPLKDLFPVNIGTAAAPATLIEELSQFSQELTYLTEQVAVLTYDWTTKERARKKLNGHGIIRLLDRLIYGTIAPKHTWQATEEVRERMNKRKANAHAIFADLQLIPEKKGSAERIDAFLQRYRRVAFRNKEEVVSRSFNKRKLKKKRSSGLQDLQSELRAFSKDVKTYRKLNGDLQRRVKDVIRLADVLAGKLQDRFDDPHCQEHIRLISLFKAHVEMNEFQRAVRNIENLREDLVTAEIDTPSIDSGSTTSGQIPTGDVIAAETRSVDDLNWYARRGIQALKTIADVRLIQNAAAAERFALRGDFQRAALLCSGRAALDFARAQRLNELAGDGIEDIPLRFGEPNLDVDMMNIFPLNGPAFDGAAIADLLGNELALAHARRGDYRSAAQAMRSMALSVDGDPLRKLLREGAGQFDEADAQQLRRLSSQLVGILEEVEGQDWALYHENVESFIDSASLALRCRRFRLARGELQFPLRMITGVVREKVEELSSLINQEEEKDAASTRGLKTADWELLTELELLIESLRSVRDFASRAIVLSEADLALTAVRELRYRAATRHVLIATDIAGRQGHPQTVGILEKLHRRDEAVFGTMNERARQAVQLIGNTEAPSVPAAREGKFRHAARVAQDNGHTAASKRFHWAANLQMDRKSKLFTELQEELAKAMAVILGRPEYDELKAATTNIYLRKPQAARKELHAIVAGVARELALIDRLQAAQKFIEGRRDQFAKLEDLVERKRMPEAAGLARREFPNAPVTASLELLLTNTEKGMNQAMADSCRQTSLGAARALEDTLKHAINFDLDNALARASAIGKAGEAAADILGKAKSLAERVAKELAALTPTITGADTAIGECTAILDSLASRYSARELKKQRVLIEAGEFEKVRLWIEQKKPHALKARSSLSILERLLQEEAIEVAEMVTPMPVVEQLPEVYESHSLIASACALQWAKAYEKQDKVVLKTADEMFSRATDDLTIICRKAVKDLVVAGSKEMEESGMASDSAMAADLRSWLDRFEKSLETGMGSGSGTGSTGLFSGRKQSYDAYYREANKRYLKWIASENMKWKKEKD